MERSKREKKEKELKMDSISAMERMMHFDLFSSFEDRVNIS